MYFPGLHRVDTMGKLMSPTTMKRRGLKVGVCTGSDGEMLAGCIFWALFACQRRLLTPLLNPTCFSPLVAESHKSSANRLTLEASHLISISCLPAGRRVQQELRGRAAAPAPGGRQPLSRRAGRGGAAACLCACLCFWSMAVGQRQTGPVELFRFAVTAVNCCPLTDRSHYTVIGCRCGSAWWPRGGAWRSCWRGTCPTRMRVGAPKDERAAAACRNGIVIRIHVSADSCRRLVRDGGAAAAFGYGHTTKMVNCLPSFTLQSGTRRRSSCWSRCWPSTGRCGSAAAASSQRVSAKLPALKLCRTCWHPCYASERTCKRSCSPTAPLPSPPAASAASAASASPA